MNFIIFLCAAIGLNYVLLTVVPHLALNPGDATADIRSRKNSPTFLESNSDVRRYEFYYVFIYNIFAHKR